MLARAQLSKLNTKGSYKSFDVPAMCKTCKTRSGHPSGGAGHGAAGGTNGTGGGRRGSTHIYYAEGQGHRLRRRAKSGLALRRASI